MTPPPLPPTQQPKRESLQLAHASLIIAALPFIGRILRARAGQTISNEIAFYWVIISAVLAFVAIVLGIIAIIRSSKGRGYAIAGILIGLFQLAVYAIGLMRR
jgi:uncharacterized Tic20 family protein